MSFSCTCTKLRDISLHITLMHYKEMHKSNLVDFTPSLFHRIGYLWRTKRYYGQVQVFKFLSGHS